ILYEYSRQGSAVPAYRRTLFGLTKRCGSRNGWTWPKKRCLELSSLNKCWSFECLKVPDTFFWAKPRTADYNFWRRGRKGKWSVNRGQPSPCRQRWHSPCTYFHQILARGPSHPCLAP